MLFLGCSTTDVASGFNFERYLLLIIVMIGINSEVKSSWFKICSHPSPCISFFASFFSFQSSLLLIVDIDGRPFFDYGGRGKIL